MEREQTAQPTSLTGIYINLAERTIEFEDRHGTVSRLRFAGEVVLYEGPPLAPARPELPDPVQTPTADGQPPLPAPLPPPPDDLGPRAPR